MCNSLLNLQNDRRSTGRFVLANLATVEIEIA